jgi:hypothetical protein
VRSARDRGVTLRGPTKPGSASQGRDGGRTPDAFRVDWRHERVTRPAGRTSSTWRASGGALAASR